MKKRVLSLLMSVVMLVSLLPATVRAAETETDELSVTQAAAPEAADGTLSGDISVGTAADLAALGGKDIVGNITLTADIKMSNTEMTPIKSLKGKLVKKLFLFIQKISSSFLSIILYCKKYNNGRFYYLIH